MPHIGMVMERSLQERNFRDAFANLLARSAVAALGKRQSVGGITDDIKDAKTAFSSWDNCMKASFCKWPVIAIIVIGGLILLSIVWCIARCLCCGVSCCCECCYCLKCCGECCGCCDPPRGKRHKYLDEPFIPPGHAENQQYRSQAPMTPNLPPPPASSAPQYAVFDDSSKKDADALPAMPSWEGAQFKKVMVEDEPVEMEPLKKPEPAQTIGLSTNNLAHSTTPSPVPLENRSPYGPPPGQGGPNGYMGATRAATDPYSSKGQGYDHDYNGYGQASHDNLNGYGMAAGAVRSHTPQQDYNNGYNSGYGRGGIDQGYPQSRTPRPYNDEYGRSGTPGAPPSYRTAPSTNNGYGPPSRMASPGPQAAYGYENPTRMRSPGPQIGFEYPQRSQTQTPNSFNRHPAPYRQYSNDSSRPLAQTAQEQGYPEATASASPIQNTGGFDFSSGYSRPAATPTQPQAANGGTAYPGYRTYKPAGAQQDSWNGV
ncbi:hypothetical protein F4804DRAFT_1138 [Jackrogersella minutella]|nr:hypothetical protein F4804DRAFT_1138 [Jackrogersella minutella]